MQFMRPMKEKHTKKQVRMFYRMIKWSKKSASRKERYCTTGQGGSGPEAGRAGESEEETSVFTDRSSSQFCQEESTDLRRKLKEKVKQKVLKNAKRLWKKLEVQQVKCAVWHW